MPGVASDHSFLPIHCNCWHRRPHPPPTHATHTPAVQLLAGCGWIGRRIDDWTTKHTPNIDRRSSAEFRKSRTMQQFSADWARAYTASCSIEPSNYLVCVHGHISTTSGSWWWQKEGSMIALSRPLTNFSLSVFSCDLTLCKFVGRTDYIIQFGQTVFRAYHTIAFVKATPILQHANFGGRYNECPHNCI